MSRRVPVEPCPRQKVALPAFPPTVKLCLRSQPQWKHEVPGRLLEVVGNDNPRQMITARKGHRIRLTDHSKKRAAGGNNRGPTFFSRRFIQAAMIGYTVRALVQSQFSWHGEKGLFLAENQRQNTADFLEKAASQCSKTIGRQNAPTPIRNRDGKGAKQPTVGCSPLDYGNFQANGR